ncbi:unnamed protein product [Clonostachys rhizophaga]|uniref:Peptidase C14 caspase domain-containing protein n=1 Tax=Clonostachys rhizophaga TaxID=160324 RepID=A0A9N9YTU9_9HYPO|nr:unnamed protein product [Clonostachys rhizophaga]
MIGQSNFTFVIPESAKPDTPPEELGVYGFTSARCFPATKAQILAAWEDIVGKTSQEDALVIYYSGHGGIAERDSEATSEKGRRRLLYLIPVDFGESKEDDWRGISDLELSKLLYRATKKTDNVTLILDCCHSTRMARAPGIVKSIDPNDYPEILKHIAKMMDEGQFDVNFHHERNPKAICVVAAAETDSAYERSFQVSNSIIQMSVLVEALDKALPGESEQNSRVSWRSIMLRIEDRLKLNCPSQSPQIEGDDLRFAFSLEKTNPHGAIPISFYSGSPMLHGGHLHGLKEKDVYGVMPFGEERLDPGKQIAEVVVDQVGPIRSLGSFTGHPLSSFDDGVKAFPKDKGLGKMAVALRCSNEYADQIRLSLQNSRFLRVSATDEDPTLATIEASNSKLLIRSHEGCGDGGDATVLLAEWQLDNLEGKNLNSWINKSVSILESLARSRHLLSMQGNTQVDSVSQQIDIEWGIVINGKTQPFSTEIVTVEEGENLYLKIRNIGKSKLWVSIFDICAESVTLLSDGSPIGHEIGEDGVYTYGEIDFMCRLVGSEMSWPDGVPKAKQMPETLVLVVTDGPIDLRGLTTSSDTPRDTNDISALRELMENLGSGGARNVPPESRRRAYLSYGIRRLFFQLKSRTSV